MQMHGRLYRSVFGEAVDRRVVASGFSIRRGVWRFRSGTLNEDYTECTVSRDGWHRALCLQIIFSPQGLQILTQLRCPVQMPESEQQLVQTAIARRFGPGGSHADKFFTIHTLHDAMALLPSSSDSDTDSISCRSDDTYATINIICRLSGVSLDGQPFGSFSQ